MCILRVKRPSLALQAINRRMSVAVLSRTENGYLEKRTVAA